VAAEGVEHVGQLNFLIDQGCDVFQGYFYSKPLPPAEFIRLLGSSS
jgi:EAL domain-containing protein (putative c-di-GMP-specific phosphodiesterase class I)